MSNQHEQDAGVDVLTLKTWAIPKSWKNEGDEPYTIVTMIGDTGPYQSDAFLLCEREIGIEYPAIVDAAPKMIESLQQALQKEQDDYIERTTLLKERIAQLLCLEAPIEEDVNF
jgi:hypothetical protein